MVRFAHEIGSLSLTKGGSLTLTKGGSLTLTKGGSLTLTKGGSLRSRKWLADAHEIASLSLTKGGSLTLTKLPPQLIASRLSPFASRLIASSPYRLLAYIH